VVIDPQAIDGVTVMYMFGVLNTVLLYLVDWCVCDV